MGTDVVGKFDGKESIIFMPEQAEDLKKSYKKNQPVRCKTTRQGEAIGKVLEQSNLLHACFKFVVDNSKNPNHANMDAVKMSCKIDIDFRDIRFCFVRPDGGVQLAYRSLALSGPDALKGAERDSVVQKAFGWCAEVIGCEVDEMVASAKEMMTGRKWQK